MGHRAIAPVLLGYFPKRLAPPPQRLRVRGVEEIGSVSLCIAGGPEGWQEVWKHNEWGFFTTPEIAWSLVPDDQQADFWLYAYALYPVEFWDGRKEAMQVHATDVRGLGSEYGLVGFDVASRSTGNYFECSPLSCNLLAEELETNSYCLFGDLEAARAFARSADDEDCEPGPYHVIEVWRKLERPGMLDSGS